MTVWVHTDTRRDRNSNFRHTLFLMNPPRLRPIMKAKAAVQNILGMASVCNDFWGPEIKAISKTRSFYCEIFCAVDQHSFDTFWSEIALTSVITSVTAGILFQIDDPH